MKSKKTNQKKLLDTSTQSRKPEKSFPCSDQRPFKSLFKSGYITAANYCAELIFQKRSEFFNSGKQPEQFWLTGNKLHGAYKGQVIQASRLLQKYSVTSVALALKAPDAKFVFKLQDTKLIPIIEKFESEKKAREMVSTEDTQPQDVAKTFSSSKKKNLFKDL